MVHVKNHHSVEAARARCTIEQKRREMAMAARGFGGGRGENNILFPIKSISDSARGPSVRAMRYIGALSQTRALARGKATER